MGSTKWMFVAVLGGLLVAASPAMAQGNGHGNGHNKHDRDDRGDDRYDYRYDHHEEAIRGWYAESASHLPPGLAKKDHLPPGLEKQLVRNGSLPPGLEKRLYPCPQELEQRLPPPPPDCAHVLVGGHVVLLNRRTNVVIDVFHFEL